MGWVESIVVWHKLPNLNFDEFGKVVLTNFKAALLYHLDNSKLLEVI